MGIRKAVKRWSCRRSLHDAVRRGNGELATKLLDKGASLNAIDANGFDPLHLAISCRDVGMVKLLVLRGADVEALGPGRGREHRSATEDDVSVAIEDVLGLRGAVTNTMLSFPGKCNRWSHTALEYAAITNQPGVIGVLVEGGASLSRRYGNGYTPLHLAAHFCSVEATIALLKHSADTNAEDNNRHTPLYLAALFPWREGAAGVVGALLRWGADETNVDGCGQTAVDRYQQISRYVPERSPLAGEVERVGKAFLEIPPTTRAWRRRGLLVLYRAHPDRVQVAGSSSRRSSGSTGGGDTAGGTALYGNAGGDLAGVVAGVVGLGAEGIFRTIVGFL